MRPIDADKTLETLEGLTELVIGEGAALVKALTFAALKSESVVPTIGGWISVKDRLPEDETEVVIIVQHRIGWYRAFAWHDEYGWHSSAEEFGDGESDFVTYWMSLPEPPEEVKWDG